MDIELCIILVVIGVCCFSFWKWVFKKFIKEDKKRKIATWITVIISTPLIYASLVLFFIFIFCYYPEKEFDVAKWKNDPENRFELSKDLINNNLLIGKTKSQIEQLLGKSEDSKDDKWVYYLGFVPSIGNIDPDILEIIFKNDKVIKVTQRNT